VSLMEVLAGFVNISSSTLEPDLHTSDDYSKTRATQPCSLSSSAPAAGSLGHVSNRSPAHGRHAPESLLLFGARVGYAPPFLAVHGVGWGLRYVVDPLLGGTDDGACPPRAAVSGGIRHCSLPAAALGFLCFLCTFLCVYCGSQFVFL
jgi:hypothetical protein